LAIAASCAAFAGASVGMSIGPVVAPTRVSGALHLRSL